MTQDEARTAIQQAVGPAGDAWTTEYDPDRPGEKLFKVGTREGVLCQTLGWGDSWEAALAKAFERKAKTT